MENEDTFVFAPFMYEQIKQIRSEELMLAIFCAVVEYGCYGVAPDFSKNDPSGAVSAMVQGICQAIDRCKARRKTNRENGKRGGAPAGSRNNPNGRRGKNQELTETNQELTYNVFMDNGSMDNGSMVDPLTFSNEKVECDFAKAKSPTVCQRLKGILGTHHTSRAKYVAQAWNAKTCKELAGIVPPYGNKPQAKKRRAAIDEVLLSIADATPGANGWVVFEQYAKFAEWVTLCVIRGELEASSSRAPFDKFMTAEYVARWACEPELPRRESPRAVDDGGNLPF